MLPQIVRAVTEAQRLEVGAEVELGEAIEEYVAVNSWQLERIEEGIRAADQGDFAADDEIARVEARFRR